MERIKILNALLQLFTMHGFAGFVEMDGTLCLSRPKKSGIEMSAACKSPDGKYILRCIQKKDVTGEIFRYTIILSDESNKLLREFGYSPEQGNHRHDIVNGCRVPNTHITTTGKLEEVVTDFIAAMNG